MEAKSMTEANFVAWLVDASDGSFSGTTDSLRSSFSALAIDSLRLAEIMVIADSDFDLNLSAAQADAVEAPMDLFIEITSRIPQEAQQ